MGVREMSLFNKELKERIKLLEYENDIINKKIEAIEKCIKVLGYRPQLLVKPRIIKEYSYEDIGYHGLKRKYRS